MHLITRWRYRSRDIAVCHKPSRTVAVSFLCQRVLGGESYARGCVVVRLAVRVDSR